MSDASANVPQSSERRAWIRYPRTLDMLWQFLGVAPREMASAQVFDISATGLGLVADEPFPLETILVVRLPTKTQGWNSHLVRVKHCQPLETGLFQVGCAFVRPLQPDQLRALVG
jgi:hypothetical protein